MKRRSLTLVALTGVIGASAVAFAAQLSGQWTVAGLNSANTRNQAAETRIGVTNVDRLAPKWVLNTAGDVSATPAVQGRFVYVPDWEGNIYAVIATAVKWCGRKRQPESPACRPKTPPAELAVSFERRLRSQAAS